MVSSKKLGQLRHPQSDKMPGSSVAKGTLKMTAPEDQLTSLACPARRSSTSTQTPLKKKL